MPKVGEIRDQGDTLLWKDQARPLVARMVRVRKNGRSSHLGPITSYVMVHTERGTAQKRKP